MTARDPIDKTPPSEWRPLKLNAEVTAALLTADAVLIKHAGRAVHDGILIAIYTNDDVNRNVGPDGHLHLSISHHRPVTTLVDGKMVKQFAPGRYPTWDEIAEAREHFTPDDIPFAMILPSTAEYVAYHPTTFHLHQLHEDAKWYT